MIKRIFFLLIGIYFSCVKSLAQEKVYFSQYEAGILIGNTGSGDVRHNRKDFTFQTFHGAHITKHHVLGFSLGLDQYQGVSIIPIALGWRGFLGKREKPQLFGGMDLGGGSPFFEKKTETEWNKTWYEGGLMISPSIGARFPSKKGKSALSLSLAYKRQDFSYFNGQKENPDSSQFEGENAGILPRGYNGITETHFLYHSMVIRLGMMF